jgi:hypothetical protein
MISRSLTSVLLLFGLGALPSAPETASAGEPELVVEGAPASSRLAKRLRSDSGKAYRAAAAWFQVEVDSPVRVRWVTEAAEMSRYGVRPGAVAGLAIPDERRVVLFAPALASKPGRIRAVLLHEFCHLLFARATAGAEVLPPRWLNEGIAMWRSGEWDLGLEWRANHTSVLTDAAAAGSIPSFRDLDASFPGGPFFHVAYAQSLSFIEWMIEREGQEGIRRLLVQLDEDLDPEPAFQAVYGLTLEEAEAEWRETLGGGWFRFLPSAESLFTAMFAILGLLVVVKFVRTRIQLRRARDELEEWRS